MAGTTNPRVDRFQGWALLGRLGKKLHVEVELAVNFGPRFLSFRLIEGGATNLRGIDNYSFA